MVNIFHLCTLVFSDNVLTEERSETEREKKKPFRPPAV